MAFYVLRSSSAGRVIGALFALMACALCLFSLALLIKTAVFVVQSEVTTGRIDRIEYHGARSESWTPIFSYSSPSGIAFQREGKVGGGSTRWSIGQQVGVRYCRSDPSDATLDTFRDLWSAPLDGVWLLGRAACILHLAWLGVTKPK